MPISMFDPTIQGLTNAMSLHQRRHQVLASNLANVETPGYRAKDLEFSRALQTVFTGTEQAPDGVGAMSARVVEDVGGPARPDGNTVDIDLQMAKLAANSGRFNTLAKLLSKRFGLMRQAIDGVR